VLEPQLRGIVDMLILASAAIAKIAALRRDPLGRGLRTRSSRARAKRFFTSVNSTSTTSPTMTNGTKMTNSPARPMPSPPKPMSSMVSVIFCPAQKVSC
jgi:hypothetical protein